MPFWRRNRIGRTFTRSSTNKEKRKTPVQLPHPALNERAHLLDHAVVASKLKVNPAEGLTDADAESRLEEFAILRIFLTT